MGYDLLENKYLQGARGVLGKIKEWRGRESSEKKRTSYGIGFILKLSRREIDNNQKDVITRDMIP
jgi:hypothetical protein